MFINALEFVNLAKSPESDNTSSGLVSSLLNVGDIKEQVTIRQKQVDNLNFGSLQVAHEVLSACGIDHSCIAVVKSDSRMLGLKSLLQRA